MNHVYRVVWNAVNGVWQVVSERARAHGKTRSVKSLLTAAVVLAAGAAGAADLPTGGVVTAGSGTITQSGNTMTVTQDTARMAANWQSFSIGQGNTVNFVQPSASAVALNRVVGSDVSVIQGALTANGQVYLINPNGVLFSPTAQVNVGGIVASTQNISTADFMAGNNVFEGTSTAAIVNQGSITAANGGTIALIAAKIINDGTLTANGGNVLLGTGSKVTLDIGGPVQLQVENDVLETLIRNGGAIKADGGRVLLTSQAAANLASSVINNTGLIEAQALETGEAGEIVLFAHGGDTRVSGSLNARGGFIETSGKTLNVAQGTSIRAAKWLIDPVNVTIDSGAGALGGSSVGASVIEAALSSGGGNTDVAIVADDSISVDADISWSANTLTLTAGGDIDINATLTATDTARLALEYGQSTADGAGSAYTVAAGEKIFIPNADAFTWKKGSAGSTKNLVFNNNKIRFGDGFEASLTSEGTLKQPWYYDEPRNDSDNGDDWFQLTYDDYPLDIQVGVGGDGSSAWNHDGTLFNTDEGTYSPLTYSLEISGYREGYGSIVSTVTLDASTQVKNTYTLTQTDMFLKTVTEVKNIGASSLENVRVWVGTRDDYIATNDDPSKTKGNITGNGFEAITDQNTQAKALKITENEDGTGAAVLFYSTSPDADIAFEDCCSFTNVTGMDPRSSEIYIDQDDGSYALFMRMTDLAPSASASMTWYYAAGPVSELTNIVNQVGGDAGVQPSPPASSGATTSQIAAIGTAQTTTQQQQSGTTRSPTQQLQSITPDTPTGGSSHVGRTVGSLDVIRLLRGGGEQGGGEGGESQTGDQWSNIGSQPSQPGMVNLYVAGYGVHLPDDLTDEE